MPETPEAALPLSDEDVARLFHETYERLAPSFSYETRKASAKPWPDVPENNRRLMIAVAAEVLDALRAARGAELDVRRVKQAVTNIAVRHGVAKDPPPPNWSLMHLYGYSAAPADMDAEIAAEYAALASHSPATEEGTPEKLTPDQEADDLDAMAPGNFV